MKKTNSEILKELEIEINNLSVVGNDEYEKGFNECKTLIQKLLTLLKQ